MKGRGRWGSPGCRGGARSSVGRSRARARRHPSATPPRAALDVDRSRAGGSDRAVEEEAGGRDDDLVAGPDERAEADPEGVHGPVRDHDLRLRVDGAPRRPLEPRRKRLAQRDEAVGRRRGHRAPQHRGDGLDDVVRQRRGRRAGERDRLDARCACLLERPLGLVRRKAAAGHDAVTGSRTCDG